MEYHCPSFKFKLVLPFPSTMITSQEELKTLIQRARNIDAVALDTEFVWERTYYPRLGLIQLAFSNEECFLIDPCALDDLSPLGELLGDPAVVKIFHDAPQDLTILHHATGAVPMTVFDTRLAAGFAGLSASISLASLITELLDIDLPKTETRTNWLKRPLNPGQIEYALDDVRYLRAARILLLTRILNPAIHRWLQEDLGRYSTEAFYVPPADSDRYLKIKGAGNLNRQALAILRELAGWREQEARRRNRPRGHIVPDQALLFLAVKGVLTTEKMQQCESLSSQSIHQYGQQLLTLINKGRNCPQHDLPSSLTRKKLTKTEQATLTQLQEFITLKSDVLGLDPSLVGNTSELRALLQHRNQPDCLPPERQSHGWRKNFLEEML